ncbi:MAG TPA: amidase family protein [Nitriliruptorales bacterium]
MNTTPSIAGRTAVDLASAVRAGDLDPVTVTRVHLDRIEALQHRIGAYLVIRREQALHEAAAVAARDDLGQLPLAGVPVAIKDVTDVAGLPTRHGSLATSSEPAQADSAVVARLRAAGAVVVGTTRTPELSLWSSTDGVFGTARNPWNTERVPGGSSGGSAAAVAAGTVPIALGTDGLGSVRIPAACCGLFGLKPGRGGGVTESDLRAGGEHWFGMSEFGPLATTVEDAALMLSVFAERPEYRDPAPPTEPLRVAVSVQKISPLTPLDHGYVTAVRDTAELLEGAGHQLRTADPGYPVWLQAALFARWSAAAAIDVQGVSDPSALLPRTVGHARAGRLMQRLGRVRPQDQQRWREHVAAFFEHHDVLLLPALAGPPIQARPWHRASWLANVKAHLDYSPFCSPWNLAQVPAASVPTGVGAAGLPLAVQLVGPSGSERRLLGLAAQIEQLRPWQRIAPAVEDVVPG